LVGVEGTGSYGAGLTRFLLAEGVRVVEVDRPNRQRRRRRGKSDPQDAITAARAAQSGDAAGAAKSRDGNVEAMRVLRVARSSARKARTQALNQMRALVATAPDELREELRSLTVFRLLERAAAFRPGPQRDPVAITKLTLLSLARRAQALNDEIRDIDAVLAPLVQQTAPELLARVGVGFECASALLVAAGDNPNVSATSEPSPTSAASHRWTPAPGNRNGTGSTAAATARPTRPSGASSSPASSTTPEPRPTSSGAPKKDSPRKKPIRCLKRYIAREIYTHLPRHDPLAIGQRADEDGRSTTQSSCLQMPRSVGGGPTLRPESFSWPTASARDGITYAKPDLDCRAAILDAWLLRS
jgi:hypothetical protein